MKVDTLARVHTCWKYAVPRAPARDGPKCWPKSSGGARPPHYYHIRFPCHNEPALGHPAIFAKCDTNSVAKSSAPCLRRELLQRCALSSLQSRLRNRSRHPESPNRACAGCSLTPNST
eukprot:5018370-Amphidinium_carterae.1